MNRAQSPRHIVAPVLFRRNGRPVKLSLMNLRSALSAAQLKLPLVFIEGRGCPTLHDTVCPLSLFTKVSMLNPFH